MPITRDDLLEFMHSKFGVDRQTLADDAPLFTSGTLDSFSMVDLVVHLEQSGGFRMTAGEVNLDNLDSISRILAYVQSKLP